MNWEFHEYHINCFDKNDKGVGDIHKIGNKYRAVVYGEGNHLCDRLSTAVSFVENAGALPVEEDMTDKLLRLAGS